jgi:crotonobetainyl-CoA:carnitine CoA-transferase CaiB-like acyl-CoA transferase
VVVTVRVAFCAVVPEMATEGVTPHVAGLVAFAGVMVTAQVRFTVPVKPFAGVTVIADVFPVVALASTVMLPLFERAKPGAGAVVTVIVVAAEVLAAKFVFPAYAAVIAWLPTARLDVE